MCRCMHATQYTYIINLPNMYTPLIYLEKKESLVLATYLVCNCIEK